MTSQKEIFLQKYSDKPVENNIQYGKFCDLPLDTLLTFTVKRTVTAYGPTMLGTFDVDGSCVQCFIPGSVQSAINNFKFTNIQKYGIVINGLKTLKNGHQWWDTVVGYADDE